MDAKADICLIVEGAYPYVTGGVSSWVHDLILAQAPLTFHLVALNADDKPRPPRFELPANVVGMTEIALQQSECHIPAGYAAARLVQELERPLRNLLLRGGRDDFGRVLDAVRRHARVASRAELLNSELAFAMLQRMYKRSVPESSFLQYFWSWRALVGGLFSVLLARLPDARVYHAISTGYAGLMMARAVLETGRAGLLTEHGIYTNERRIEIAMAEWLTDRSAPSLDIEKRRRNLRDVWLDAFIGYSRTCYECSSRIITLYRGNQLMQERDGALADRLVLIPNGVDVDFYGAIPRDTRPRRPTIGLIGRVVPIKDVKTYVRAVALLRELVPQVRALMLGPIDEDPIYFRECADMVAYLGLGNSFEFCGRVQLRDYLGQIDVVVLTSLSEAQPLVLLEAGAAGVPSVATNVGSCRDIIEGCAYESPPLGPGGFVTPLANPRATAQALAELLLDPALRSRCAEAIRQRTRRYYSKHVVDATYRALYEGCLAVADRAAAPVGGM
ncbi:MAG: GT4 family glycosyltransferase PelF [Burkholderiaceae bacterium]